MKEYLKIGEKAKNFTLKNKNQEDISLSDFLGKKVILYFYPKDNTKGCTTEACDFKNNLPNFTEKNAVILGISKDSTESHAKFATKYDLPFEILSDPEHQVIKEYGAWQLKKNYGKEYMGIVRTTYVINEKGLIEKVYQVKRVNGHVQKILEEL